MEEVFVGRESELGLLAGCLEVVRAGSPTTVLLSGDAGFGKTALLQRFLAGAGDLRLLLASGEEAESALQYGVLDQLLAAAREAGAELRAILTSQGPLPDPMAAGARFLDVLGQVQDDRPVLVVVDDAQWADAPSLRALTFALRRLRHDQVLTVLCARDATDLRLPEALRRLVDDRGNCVTIGGLDADDLRRLAMESRGICLTLRAAERLRDHTGGNPLHARALLEEVPSEAIGDARRSLPSPASFARIVVSRLRACSASAERLAAAAAVLGERAPLATAVALSDLSEAPPALEELASFGILVRHVEPDGAYVAFAHPLVRAAVYGSLGPVRRSELHARAGKLLSGSAALDHRVSAAAAPDSALVADLADAAAYEVSRGAWAAAAGRLLAAAAVSADEPTRVRFLLEAVDHLLSGGEVGAATALSDRVHAVPESALSAYLLGHLAFLHGRHLDALAHLNRAWTLHDPITEEELAAATANLQALLSVVRGRGREASEWGQRALSAGAPSGPLTAMARAHAAIGLAISGRAEEGLELLRLIPDELPEPERLSLMSGRGAIEGWVGELAAARADLATVADALGLGPWPTRLTALGNLAHVEFRLGEWDAALVHSDLAISLGEDTEQGWLLPFLHTGAALVLAAQGRWELAEAHVAAALGGSRGLATADVGSTCYSGQAAAHLAAARGDHNGVLRAVAPLVALQGIDGVDEPGVVSWRELYTEALVAIGRVGEADSALTPYEEVAASRGRRSAMAGAARARGQVAWALGRPDQAEKAFETGLSLMEGLPMPFDRALLTSAYGRFLRRLGRRRDAAARLSEAHRLFALLGAGPYAKVCERELAGCGLHPSKRKVRDPARLTPQELSVARLVASGMTNTEVAEQLVVSVKTVEFHLHNVFSKLTITSRRQLASHPALVMSPPGVVVPEVAVNRGGRGHERDS